MYGACLGLHIFGSWTLEAKLVHRADEFECYRPEEEWGTSSISSSVTQSAMQHLTVARMEADDEQVVVCQRWGRAGHLRTRSESLRRVDWRPSWRAALGMVITGDDLAGDITDTLMPRIVIGPKLWPRQSHSGCIDFGGGTKASIKYGYLDGNPDFVVANSKSKCCNSRTRQEYDDHGW